MQLEKQIQMIGGFGFALEPGVTVEDLLYSFDREGYEAEPFDLIFFIMGVEIEREPWGRRFCKRIWNFDTECIEQTGDYVRIAEELSDVAGKPDALESITDFVDLESKTGWLKYKVSDVERHWDIEIDDDWADPIVTSYIMDDLETDGRRFYGKDNGQASIICYLAKEEAKRLNELCHGAWSPLVPNDLETALKSKSGWMASLRKWFG